jgi:GR25 family glycosyltransferase involved in LPS biosynthesis
MKAYVITILDNDLSVKSAERCIASAKRFGLDVAMWPAVTPNHPYFEDLQKTLGIVPENFSSKYSRRDNAIACFLSMAGLWTHSVETGEDVLILEHDALMTGRFPPLFKFDKVCTLGQPSYGVYNTPLKLGTGPLVQKEYFKGAHAYAVSPEGAKDLLENIPEKCRPTDVYLNILNFPYLEEYYPWVFRVDDSFSTIQKIEGCHAKHNYVKGKEISIVEP